jgi:hypothetical protein
MSLPATQRFWRTHGRIFVLPEQPVVDAGPAAVLTRYRDAAGRFELAILSDAATFQVLRTIEAPLAAASQRGGTPCAS